MRDQIISIMLSATPVTDAGPFPTTQLLGYLALVLIGVVGSAVFSGSETAMYALSRVRLLLRQNEGHASAIMLRHELDQPERLLTTLLLGNNAVNFLTSFGITAILTQILRLGDWQSIVFQALALTPLLFVFGETIPKEFCRSHADGIAYVAAPVVRVTRILLTVVLLLPISMGLARILSFVMTWRQPGTKPLTARRRMAALLHEGVGHGVLSPHQTDLADRALEMSDLHVRDCMVPWQRVVRFDATLTRDQFTRDELIHPGLPSTRAGLTHTRYPVIDTASGKPTGVVNILDFLTAPELDCTVASVSSEVVTVTPDQRAAAALDLMRRRGADLVVVVQQGRPVGVITMIDLVEPITGALQPEA